MPEKHQKIQGLTRNEIAVLSVIVVGLVAYVGYMLLPTGGNPKEPTGPTREVIVNKPEQSGGGDAELSPRVRRKSEYWLIDTQDELASEPGVPGLQPEVQVYEDDNVRIPFRVMIKRQSEDLLEKNRENKEPELTE